MKKLVFLPLIFVLIFSLVACGSQPEPEADSNVESSETVSDENDDKAFKVGMNADPTTLDPFVYSTTVDRVLIKNIFNSLVIYDLDTLQVKNELAKNIDISEDGLTYTIELEDNVVFHNDKPLTSDDVKYSIEQAMKPEASRTSSLLEHVENIETVDEGTLKIVLGKRDNEFLHSLTDVHIAPNDDTIEHASSPVGTGPFAFKEWNRNEAILLEKNENYWKEGLPKLARVEFRSIPDSSVKLMQLQNGQVDLIDIVPLSEVETVQNDENIEVDSFEPDIAIGTHFMLINNSKAPFNDKRFRQAINYALDRESMEKAMFGSFSATSSPIPTSYAEYNPDILTYEYDVEKATSLLNESSYKGEEVELLYHPIDVGYDMVAQFTEQSLNEIGINVKMKSVEIAQWTENVFNQKAFDLALTSIVPKPSVFDLLNHPYGKINGESIQWDNKEWYEKLNEAKEADPEQSYNLIQELQAEVLEESPAIIVGKNIEFNGRRTEVVGFKPHPQGALILEEVEVK